MILNSLGGNEQKITASKLITIYYGKEKHRDTSIGWGISDMRKESVKQISIDCNLFLALYLVLSIAVLAHFRKTEIETKNGNKKDFGGLKTKIYKRLREW